MNKKTIHFSNGPITGQVSLLGAMLGPTEFLLPNNKIVQPFSVAPWPNDANNKVDELPPLLRNLGGEWPCVPFGVPTLRTDLPSEWMQNLDNIESIEDTHMHGFSSNHEWTDISTTSKEANLSIAYPVSHPVSKLTRTISVASENQLDLALIIEARKPVELPIGLHGVFKLPKKTGNAKLIINSLTTAHTYPVPVESNISILEANQHITNLQQVRKYNGGLIDVTTLPLATSTEELILVNLSDGKVKLKNYEELYEVVLTWDINQFPCCLLWISNCGRDYYPWSSRFQAIGIEPIASAFDLGVVHSRNPSSPLQQQGIKTNYLLTGLDYFKYQITVNSIKDDRY